ncbi:MAG TPA: transcriptional regulator MraZ [Gammaproteobacteria bacterium]|nr:transcriptional regulator MraZ [Gammaproteobacteria bacterium]
MFRGVNQVNLDSKGRIAIPTRYREELHSDVEKHMVITVNNTNDRCLWLYTLPEWERIEADVTALPSFDKRATKLKRFFIGQATDVDMDASGRLLLPPPLREFAQLKKHIVLAGQGNKFEIWDEENWTAQRDAWMEDGLGDGPMLVELESLSL